VLGEAVLGIGAVILIVRNTGDALQIVSRRRRELHLVVLDFDADCRGMALLSGNSYLLRGIANPRRRFRRFGACECHRVREWRSSLPQQTAPRGDACERDRRSNNRTHRGPGCRLASRNHFRLDA